MIKDKSKDKVLSHYQHFQYTICIGCAYQTGFCEIAFAFSILFGQDMTFVSVLTLDLSGSGYFEAFFSA